MLRLLGVEGVLTGERLPEQGEQEDGAEEGDNPVLEESAWPGSLDRQPHDEPEEDAAGDRAQ